MSGFFFLDSYQTNPGVFVPTLQYLDMYTVRHVEDKEEQR